MAAKTYSETQQRHLLCARLCGRKLIPVQLTGIYERAAFVAVFLWADLRSANRSDDLMRFRKRVNSSVTGSERRRQLWREPYDQPAVTSTGSVLM
ncbi:hypothetical protein AOLI_G00007670 [Acnodon oligacanthus]